MRGQKREEPAEVSQSKVLVEGSSCLQFLLVMVASGSGLMFLCSQQLMLPSLSLDV